MIVVTERGVHKSSHFSCRRRKKKKKILSCDFVGFIYMNRNKSIHPYLSWCIWDNKRCSWKAIYYDNNEMSFTYIYLTIYFKTMFFFSSPTCWYSFRTNTPFFFIPRESLTHNSDNRTRKMKVFAMTMGLVERRESNQTLVYTFCIVQPFNLPFRFLFYLPFFFYFLPAIVLLLFLCQKLRFFEW